MTTKQNDDLTMLAAQAEGLQAEQEAAQEDAAAVPAEATRQTNGQILASTFQLAREAGCVLCGVNSPRQVLNDPMLEQLGNAWGAVADKRGWDLQAIMGDYAAEVAAVMLTITLAAQLNKAVSAELAAREKKAETAQEADAVVA